MGGGVLIDTFTLTAAEIKDSLDSSIELALTDIQSEQELFYEKNRRYDQKFESFDGTATTSVHVYDSPKGRGYVLRTSFIKGGVTYVKAVNYGPEDRGHDWREASTPETR